MDAALSDAELVDEVLTWAARVARGDAQLITLIGELDLRGAWTEHGVTSCAHWLSWRVGWSGSTARERVRVGRALRELPSITEAFVRGRVTYSQVRAITRVATAADEADWLALARHCTGSQLDKAVRGAERAVAADRDPEDAPDKPPAVRTEWDSDGDLILTMRIPAHQAVPVLTALEQHQSLEQTEREHKLAALVADVTGASADAAGAAPSPDGRQLELPDPPATADQTPACGASAEAPIDLRAVPAALTTGPLEEYPYVEPPYPVTFDGSGWQKTPEQRAADQQLIRDWEHRRDAERAIRDTWNDRRQRLLTEAAIQRVETGRATLADALVRALLRPTDCLPVTVQLLHDPLSGWARTVKDEFLPPATLSRVLETLPRKRTRRGSLSLVPHDQHDLGRTSRVASPALRRQLGTLDGERCRFPTCTHTRYLHAHHITFWSQGGPTDLANLVLLCTKHHRLLHNAGYSLALDPQRNLSVTTADGTRVDHCPPLPDAPAEALPSADPCTLDRQYLGDRFDLGYVVNTMLSHAA